MANQNFPIIKADPTIEIISAWPKCGLSTRMLAEFFYIRMFGAVMSTKVNAGQALGPVQIALALSVDPIVTLEQSINRVLEHRSTRRSRSPLVSIKAALSSDL